MPTKKHWRVEVEWEDSQLFLGGWEPISDALKDRRRQRCVSVGFVLADDKRGIVLASSLNNDNAFGIVSIPGSQITKRRRLR